VTLRGLLGVVRAQTRRESPCDLRSSAPRGRERGRVCAEGRLAYNRPTMKWVYVEDIAAYDSQDVEIRGWVYHKRSSGKVRFLLVRDGTGLIQATAFSADKDVRSFSSSTA